MRHLGRCAFILLGLPNIISFTIVSVLALFILPFIPTAKRDKLLIAMDVLAGLLSVCIGILILPLLRVGQPIWVPIIVAVWFAIHFARINKTPAFLRASAGVLTGWWVYEMLLAA